jgi:hypothetical protein
LYCCLMNATVSLIFLIISLIKQVKGTNIKVLKCC